MRTNNILRGITLTLVICAFALVLSTCGGGKKGSVVQGLSPGSSPEDKTSPEGLDYPVEVSLDNALAELDALETPDGVDPALFAQLKDELAKQLNAKGVSKIASTPPTGEANRVDDLELIDNGDGTYTLTWHYKNSGDYDQNGTVGISDITPIAMHYGESATPDNEWIDGDDSGTVGISDITPLAMNFGVDCAGYLTEGDDTVEGAFTQVDTVGFSEATGTGRKQFAYELGVPEYEYYRVVPKDGLGESGTPSFIVGVHGGEEPTVTSVSPTTGVTESEVTFTAQVSGDPPFTYAWNFGGGATPNSSSEESPTVTLAEPGDYSASVTVSNAYGDDALPFTLTVNESVVPGRGDWWMFGREPTHNRRSPYVGPQTGSLRWGYETGDCVRSSPAIGVDGTIYVGGSDNYLYAIYPDGTLKWRYETGDWVYSSPAIGVDGTIYVGSSDNYLYAIYPDGTLKWRYETGDWVSSSPAIGVDGTIYVGGSDNYLYAIYPGGTLKWRYETGDSVNSSPATGGADGTIYVGSSDNYLYAIYPDGTLKWCYETGDSVNSSPAIGADGTIYVGSGDNYLYAIYPDGTLKWRYETGDWVSSSPAIGADGTIYVGSGDNCVYATNADGTLKWSCMLGGVRGLSGVFSSPAIGADGTIYVGSWDGYLYVITDNETEGTLKWTYETGGYVYSSPAIGENGTVYVGSGNGYLYAFSDESPPTIITVNFSPASGAAGWDVTFTAEVWGTTPFTYSWDFGAGAEPDTSDKASPTVTLGNVGEYDASLTVTNEYGVDTFDFTLTVEEDRPKIVWVSIPGSPLALYHYNGGIHVCGVTVYEYFEVTARSGDVELTASIWSEEKSDTFPVEEGGIYQFSVYIAVIDTFPTFHNLLTISSPSASFASEITLSGQFRFLSLGEIGLQPYEP